jgi:hypothetical protein
MLKNLSLFHFFFLLFLTYSQVMVSATEQNLFTSHSKVPEIYMVKENFSLSHILLANASANRDDSNGDSIGKTNASSNVLVEAGSFVQVLQHRAHRSGAQRSLALESDVRFWRTSPTSDQLAAQHRRYVQKSPEIEVVTVNFAKLVKKKSASSSETDKKNLQAPQLHRAERHVVSWDDALAVANEQSVWQMRAGDALALLSDHERFMRIDMPGPLLATRDAEQRDLLRHRDVDEFLNTMKHKAPWQRCYRDDVWLNACQATESANATTAAQRQRSLGPRVKAVDDLLLADYVLAFVLHDERGALLSDASVALRRLQQIAQQPGSIRRALVERFAHFWEAGSTNQTSNASNVVAYSTKSLFLLGDQEWVDQLHMPHPKADKASFDALSFGGSDVEQQRWIKVVRRVLERKRHCVAEFERCCVRDDVECNEEQWLSICRWYTETDRAVEHVLHGKKQPSTSSLTRPYGGMVVVRLTDGSVGADWFRTLNATQAVCGLGERVALFGDFAGDTSGARLLTRLSANSVFWKAELARERAALQRRVPELRDITYEHMKDVPALVLVIEKARMGDTFPASLGVLDLRCRHRAGEEQQGAKMSRATIIQELGRLCRYARGPIANVGYALVSSQLRRVLYMDEQAIASDKQQFMSEARDMVPDNAMQQRYPKDIKPDTFNASFMRGGATKLAVDGVPLPHFFVKKKKNSARNNYETIKFIFFNLVSCNV